MSFLLYCWASLVCISKCGWVKVNCFCEKEISWIKASFLNCWNKKAYKFNYFMQFILTYHTNVCTYYMFVYGILCIRECYYFSASLNFSIIHSIKIWRCGRSSQRKMPVKSWYLDLSFYLFLWPSYYTPALRPHQWHILSNALVRKQFYLLVLFSAAFRFIEIVVGI